jgi:hypothetical protein
MEMHRVFDNTYISDTTTTIATSQGMANNGNKVVMAVTMINASGLSDMTFKLQGTFDGTTWVEISGSSLTTLSAFGYGEASASTTDFAFIRCVATLAAGKALFSVSLSFTTQ